MPMGCKTIHWWFKSFKEALKEKDIPYLSLDSDGTDRRNSPAGQIKTRMKLF